jgi:hypothetical protein
MFLILNIIFMQDDYLQDEESPKEKKKKKKSKGKKEKETATPVAKVCLSCDELTSF